MLVVTKDVLVLREVLLLKKSFQKASPIVNAAAEFGAGCSQPNIKLQGDPLPLLGWPILALPIPLACWHAPSIEIALYLSCPSSCCNGPSNSCPQFMPRKFAHDTFLPQKG